MTVQGSNQDWTDRHSWSPSDCLDHPDMRPHVHPITPTQSTHKLPASTLDKHLLSPTTVANKCDTLFSTMSHPFHAACNPYYDPRADPSLHGNLPYNSNYESSLDQSLCHPHHACAAHPSTRTSTQRRQHRSTQQRRGHPPSRHPLQCPSSAVRQNPNASYATHNS